MNWIDKFAESSFKLYSGNTIDAFQPLDFFHFFPLWYPAWIDRFMSVMDVLDLDHKSYKEIAHLLPGPSSMRAIIQKLIPTYVGVSPDNAKNFKRVAEFFARMLSEACPDDPFGNTRNPLHSQRQITEITRATPWLAASPKTARNLGQLITAAGSLVHGLYNDVVTDFGWDAYGPYDIAVPGKNYQLFIRHFTDLAPCGLWPSEFLTPIKEIKIYQFYEDVEWELAYLGCHTVLRAGDPIAGLRYFAVSVNGKFIDPEAVPALTKELAEKAADLYSHIRGKNFEELKTMVMKQECYQLKKLFDAAYLNWQPTAAMNEQIKDKALMTGILPFGTLMTDLTKYKELFHIDRFRKEVLEEP